MHTYYYSAHIGETPIEISAALQSFLTFAGCWLHYSVQTDKATRFVKPEMDPANLCSFVSELLL